ncbi:MAG: hypothetical protein ACREMR_09070, partial [Gemmatimonadales bacterium]
GGAQLRALQRVRPLHRVYAYDREPGLAERFAADLSAELALDVRPVTELRPATRESDVVVTCTPSRAPILGTADVRPGTFVAAVGADHPDKQEIDPALLAAATIVAADEPVDQLPASSAGKLPITERLPPDETGFEPR